MFDLGQKYEESSSSEQNSFYRPPKPPKIHHLDTISNLSLLQKTSAEDFETDISDIINSNLLDKRKHITSVLLNMNQSLLLAVNNYMSFDARGEESFDSIVSDQIAQNRINGFDVYSWKINLSEVSLSKSSLSRMAALVKKH